MKLADALQDRRVVLLFGAAVGALIGFAVCQGCMVPETREVVKYQDRVVEKQVVHEVQVKVRDESAQQTRVVYRDRVVRPDGTTHEREVERTEAATQVHEKATATTERVVTRDVVREVEKRVEVRTPAPGWRVGAMAGFSVSQVRLLPPDPGPLGFGAIVERRIVGPVSVGAWGLSSGQGGLLVTVEF